MLRAAPFYLPTLPHGVSNDATTCEWRRFVQPEFHAESSYLAVVANGYGGMPCRESLHRSSVPAIDV